MYKRKRGVRGSISTLQTNFRKQKQKAWCMFWKGGTVEFKQITPLLTECYSTSNEARNALVGVLVLVQFIAPNMT